MWNLEISLYWLFYAIDQIYLQFQIIIISYENEF